MISLALALLVAGPHEPSTRPSQSCLVLFSTNDSDYPLNDYVWQRSSNALKTRNPNGDRPILIWARWLGGRNEADNIKTATRQAEELKSRVIALDIPVDKIRIVAQGRSFDSERGFLAITFESPTQDSASAKSPLVSC